MSGMKWRSRVSPELVCGSGVSPRSRKKVIIVYNRRSFPLRLTPEDFEIQQSKVPRRARFIYMLGDTTDAEIMFAWVDAKYSSELERAAET